MLVQASGIPLRARRASASCCAASSTAPYHASAAPCHIGVHFKSPLQGERKLLGGFQDCPIPYQQHTLKLRYEARATRAMPSFPLFAGRAQAAGRHPALHRVPGAVRQVPGTPAHGQGPRAQDDRPLAGGAHRHPVGHQQGGYLCCKAQAQHRWFVCMPPSLTHSRATPPPPTPPPHPFSLTASPSLSASHLSTGRPGHPRKRSHHEGAAGARARKRQGLPNPCHQSKGASAPVRLYLHGRVVEAEVQGT